ncbi:nucleoside diphosphate kinase 6 isoform X3 [Cherax quadricarinatus]|uniref:nucleoside diphosphate kinase 6 isoform X3 n=1 Tax=Cherax quadricarinatus TaxID=27406 RepID=UPI00387E7831
MTMAIRGRLQLTLALLKPDVSQVPHVLQAIHNRIIQEDFLVVRHKKIWLSEKETQKFYEEHKEKFFYNRLVTFMASGPISALILAHEDAINRWRSVMGPTKVYKTKYEAPDTIRGMYGLTDTRNSTHGSGTCWYYMILGETFSEVFTLMVHLLCLRYSVTTHNLCNGCW